MQWNFLSAEAAEALLLHDMLADDPVPRRQEWLLSAEAAEELLLHDMLADDPVPRLQEWLDEEEPLELLEQWM